MSRQKLQEELLASQQDCKGLQDELQQVLLQLDVHVRLDASNNHNIK